nr:serine/threonine-protein phosphatase 7 long form like [Quercus suber]
MAAVPTQIPNEFGPGPIEDSVLKFLKEHRSCAIWEGKVVWEPYKDELAHLPPFCVAGRDIWTTRVPLVCFWLVEKHTPDCVLRQFGMVQEIPPYVDTDEAIHAIDLRGKITVNWRDKHYGHI